MSNGRRLFALTLAPSVFITTFPCVASVITLLYSPDARASSGRWSATENPGRAARLEYRVRYDPARDPAVLHITLKGSGLPKSGSEIVGELRDWGEWRNASFPYLRDLRLGGHLVPMKAIGIVPIEAQTAAEGTFELQYELLVYPYGSAQHGKRPLLPYHRGGNLFAFAANTLIGLTCDGGPLNAQVTVSINAPEQVIFTGWGGPSSGSQSAPAPNPAFANAVFAIGQPRGQTFTEADSTLVEVMQFAERPDATAAVADVAARVLPSYERATGRPAGTPVRIVIEGSSSSGGTATEAGLRIGVGETGRLSESVRELIAHELFHLWLGGGGHLREDGSLLWFGEGFTDYFALWHCAASGVTSPDRFGERMLQIDRKVRTRSALGRVAFADAGVSWRDGDGPRETLAYGGGALLAFVIDVHLRQRSKQNVADVIRKLLELTSREYNLEHVREAMQQLGLTDLYHESIVRSNLPDVRPLLTSIGFEEVQERKALTYLGIEAEYAGPAGSTEPIPVVVTAVDPEGPAARAGIKPGDRIFGFEPLRSNPPELTDQAPARFRFGLTLIASGAETATFDVMRNGQTMRIDVSPVLTHGGRATSLRWNPKRGSGFFKITPPQQGNSSMPRPGAGIVSLCCSNRLRLCLGDESQIGDVS